MEEELEQTIMILKQQKKNIIEEMNKNNSTEDKQKHINTLIDIDDKIIQTCNKIENIKIKTKI